ncbi:flagellar export chaperone FliS [Rhizobacter sp. Root404]|jgi:flagellar protein FliS|uniref:flagellar export chaperone FliS n=1 Tax=Rhizobacter sp. Root404 TaxID=1736528 RepID=UPI000700FEC7|nr:flagellar export chaperone FliS [Rhizobacter sp. Root404]KQW40427.1 flagellar export chaperone FliS [Rhizobacter sp. Root404]
MFTQSRPHQQSMSTMYHKVQTDTGVDAASPHRLVEMLFEGFFDSCSQARGHIRAGNVEQKCRSLARAARIVDEGLKAPLDLQAGGELAKDLRDLYAYVTVRLTHANLQNDEAAVDECQRLMRPIYSAWTAIGGQVGSA